MEYKFYWENGSERGKTREVFAQAKVEFKDEHRNGVKAPSGFHLLIGLSFYMGFAPPFIGHCT